MRLILNSVTFFFRLHNSRMYFLNDKFNESYEYLRIVSMSQVQTLKINVLFA